MLVCSRLAFVITSIPTLWRLWQGDCLRPFRRPCVVCTWPIPQPWRQAAARQAKVAAGGAQQPDLGAGTREVRELELFAPPQPT